MIMYANAANPIAPRLRTFAGLAAQLAILWAIGVAANAVVARTHVPIPGNALAMLVTFTLLSTGVIRLAHVDRAAALLVKHLAVFFIPYAVGIVGVWDVLAPHAFGAFVALLASVTLGIMTTGVVAQRLARAAS